MATRPDGMMRKDRGIDNVFRSDEVLFRRVPPVIGLDEDGEIPLAAIELPDMSVNRQKYGPAWWTRFAIQKNAETGQLGTVLTEWAIIGFKVEDVPPQLVDKGVFHYEFRPVHAPDGNNYPHTEVRVYETVQGPNGAEEIHVKGKEFERRVDPILHMRWREQLRRHCSMMLREGEIPPEQAAYSDDG